MPYRLHAVGEGKLIIYDLPENLPMNAESATSWQTFLTAILSVAEVQGYCRLSDGRLGIIPLEKRGGGLGLFVMNDARKQVTADIVFPLEVEVSDLAVSLSAKKSGPRPIPSNRFSLEVPPCGILPLAVDGGKLVQPKSGTPMPGKQDDAELFLNATDGPGGPRSEGIWN